MNTVIRNLKHRIEYLGVLWLAWIASRVSLKTLRKLGRSLGCWVFSVVRIRRQVTLDNLRQAFPDKDEREIVKLARATYEHFGMTMLESLKLLSMSREEVTEAIQILDDRALQQAKEAGRGAVMITGHMGNWEYLGAWVSINGFPATFMFQEQANPYVSRLIRTYRERMGMDVVPRGMALRSYLRALKQGRFVAAVADQDAGRNGIFVHFLGRPASTPTGPARFALKTGAPIIFSISYRDQSGHLFGQFETLNIEYDPGDEAVALRRIVEAYTRQLETWIRKYPEQWFWMHRRWKTQPERENSVSQTREALHSASW